MSFGVLPEGFKRKTYNDIILSMEAKAKELYGEDINLSDRSPLGLFLQNIAWELQEMWQVGEDVYNSAFVDTAEYAQLDNVSKYITLQRKKALKSEGNITIYGDADTLIEKGFRVSTEASELVFETIGKVVIGENGEIEVPIIALHTGEMCNVPANTITKIVNPMSGVSSVNNKEPTFGGTDVEKDTELRERYYRSVSMGGSSTREAVESSLLALENVSDAVVEENESMELKGEIPPKSLAPFVYGGDDQEIANAILSSKAGGIRSFGDIYITAKDNKDVEHLIGFTRPDVVDLYVRLAITKGIGYVGDSEVKRAVLSYIGGQGEEGITYKGLKLGENVVISRIIAQASRQGVIDVGVEVSSDNLTWIDTNIPIGKKEIAKSSWDKVVITYA